MRRRRWPHPRLDWQLKGVKQLRAVNAGVAMLRDYFTTWDRTPIPAGTEPEFYPTGNETVSWLGPFAYAI